MLEYLEDKYGREFVVDQYVENRYWYGSDALVVHPEGEPTILFRVNALEKKDERAETFSDDYVLAQWSAQLTERYRSRVEEALGQQIAFKAAVFAPDMRILEGMEGKDVAEVAAGESGLASIWYLAVPCDAMDDCGERYAESLHGVIELQREAGFERYALSVGMVSSVPRFESDVLRMDILGYEWGAYEDGVMGYFSPGFAGSASISSPQDVADSIIRTGDR